MTRNQLANDLIKKFSGDPMFTVSQDGKIQPTTQQSVDPGGTLLIQAAPDSLSPYAGYVCAWRSGVCRCAELVTDLNGEPHMKIRSTPFHVSSSVTLGFEYTIYTSPGGSGPNPFENNGDLRVGH